MAAAWMMFSKARSNARRAVTAQLASALHGPLVDRCRTAVAIASGTVDDYSLLLETVNDLSHALPCVLRGVIWEPFHEIEI